MFCNVGVKAKNTRLLLLIAKKISKSAVLAFISLQTIDENFFVIWQ